MARIRTIKPDFFADEKLSKLKRDVRILYIGLWVFSDDHGTVRSNPIWIKSNVFPYDEELRVNDVKLWLDALVKARMLEPFCYNGEGFYNIRTFDTHQKVEKKSKPSVPLEEKRRLLAEQSGNSRGIVGEYSVPEVVHSKGKEEVVSSNRANALVADKPATGPTMKDYVNMIDALAGKEKKDVVDSLKNLLSQKPLFAEPYVDYWNIAVAGTNIPEARGIPDSRSKQVRIRVRENNFDFLEIIRKIRGSNRLKNDSDWFSFDWVFKNDKNYLKIIEGNYD